MLQAYIEQINGGTDFGELAKTESDCSSASRGGDLGEVCTPMTYPRSSDNPLLTMVMMCNYPTTAVFEWANDEAIRRRDTGAEGRRDVRDCEDGLWIAHYSPHGLSK